MRKKYFIQQYMQHEYLHGGIGGADAEKILLARGFEPVYFPHEYSFSFVAKINRFFFLVKTFFRVKQGSVIVFLFPVYAKMNKLLLTWLGGKKNIHIICFIADIDGIKDGDEELLIKEIKFFRRFRYFVVHNEKMKEWVHKNVTDDAVTAAVEFFDFLTPPVDRQSDLSHDIVFAGNLEKSSFVEKLYLLQTNRSSLHFHVYGPGKTDAVSGQENVTWHGVEKPYDLPGKLIGSFGLLWDGVSIDKPAGSHGHYMEYISHHKLSLYILSKLPIIVPAATASAMLIEKYKIGLIVNNLYEIEGKIKNLSLAEYRQMQVNMNPLSEMISKGQCLSNAIDVLMKGIS